MVFDRCLSARHGGSPGESVGCAERRAKLSATLVTELPIASLPCFVRRSRPTDELKAAPAALGHTGSDSRKVGDGFRHET